MLRSVSGEALLQRAPSVAQAVDLNPGKVDIAGAQVADGYPVMTFRLFDRGVEIGQVVGHGKAVPGQEGKDENCGACNADQHGYSTKCEIRIYAIMNITLGAGDGEGGFKLVVYGG